MAKSGIVKTNTVYESYFWVKWEQLGNQDIPNNRTQIKWSCGVSCGHSFYSNAIKMSSVYINGVLVYSGGTYSNYSKGEHTIASGTLYIPHDGDGKKTFNISAFTGWLYSSYNYSASTTSHSLTAIPRQATLTSAPDFTDEQNPTITYSNPAGSAVTALDVCISLDGSQDDVEYRAVPTGGSSYTFDLTEAERNVLRNATISSNSRTVQFFLRTTIAGSVFYSTAKKTLTIVNASPTFADDKVSYADVNSSVVAITGNNQHIVQNQSSLTATFGAATANKGAKITGYTVELNGVTQTASASGSVSFGAVNSSQNVILTVTAKDSRGNTTSVSKNVTVLAWSLPVITASLERLNNYEDETHLTVDASVSSVNGKNTMAISYQYKQSGGVYGSAVQISNKTQYTIECDKNNAYMFSITVQDLFGSTTKELLLDKGKFPLFIDTEMNAVGINEFPSEGEALHVAGGEAVFEEDIRIGSEKVADFIVGQGITDGWTWRKWNSGIAECWCDYSYMPTTTGNEGVNVDYPFDFNSPPIVTANLGRNGTLATNIVVCDTSGNRNNSLSRCELFVRGVASTDYDIQLLIHAIGILK